MIRTSEFLKNKENKSVMLCYTQPSTKKIIVLYIYIYLNPNQFSYDLV